MLSFESLLEQVRSSEGQVLDTFLLPNIDPVSAEQALELSQALRLCKGVKTWSIDCQSLSSLEAADCVSTALRECDYVKDLELLGSGNFEHMWPAICDRVLFALASNAQSNTAMKRLRIRAPG